jgi:hypothetical protein
MGLDQHAFAVSKQFAETLGADEDDRTELHYWRKHPYLQGWMENLWRESCSDEDMYEPFNCKYVQLHAIDLDHLEIDVNGNNLPETDGFFFGDDSCEHYKEQDLKFIADARQAIADGKAVFYYSWW